MFLTFIRRTTSKPVILLMNNCGPHGSDLTDPKGQVTIRPLPPNCTAVHQPMDQGVIAAWKANYRMRYLTEMLENIETLNERREANKSKKNGMKGMEEGYDPHMLDVSRLVFESWNDVGQSTIARCWVKSKILPPTMDAELNNEWGKTKAKSTEEAAGDLVKMLSSISIDSRDQILRSSDIRATPTVDEALGWFNIEENDEVLSAMVDDMSLGIEDASGDNEAEGIDDDEDDTGDPTSYVSIPKDAVLVSMFDELEELAYNSNVPQASVFLRKAKKAFSQTRTSRAGSAPRQSLITEMFSQKK